MNGGWKHPWEPNQHSPAASGNASHQQYRRSHLLAVSQQAQLVLHGAHLEMGCSGIPHGPTGGDLYYRGRTTGIFPAGSLQTGCPCSSTSALWHSGDRGKLGQRPSNGLTALHKDPPGARPSGIHLLSPQVGESHPPSSPPQALWLCRTRPLASIAHGEARASRATKAVSAQCPAASPILSQGTTSPLPL